MILTPLFLLALLGFVCSVGLLALLGSLGLLELLVGIELLDWVARVSCSGLILGVIRAIWGY